MKLSKSQERLLDKLRNTPAEDLTPEDLEDLEELEQLEKKEKEDQEKEEKEKEPDPVNEFTKINQTMEEILKCLKPQQNPQEVEIPTPPPVITNQEVEQVQDQPIQESKVKKFLKAIW